jgi:DNA-damage-inducible protein D
LSESIDYFHYEEEYESFEDFGQVNGGRKWFARDLMLMLGYENFSSFENAINKAIQACTTLKIPILDNFVQVDREINSKAVRDYKLSRFACYLVAMNGDTKKPQVARAQAYFAAMAETVQCNLQNAESVERLLIRDDISERERSFAGVAKSAGVQYYSFFQNEGYSGMYNMNLGRELAANLFRITQTEAKIKTDRVRGQAALESTAFEVGRKVRQTMEEISGTRPENLPIAEDMTQVKRGLKQAQRELAKIDKPPKQVTEG